MNDTLTGKAVVGRRILFEWVAMGREYPGIVTRVDGPCVRIRLDGQRSTLTIPADSDRLTYLDQVVEVPALPMGAFHPTLADLGGFEYVGVPVCQLVNEEIVALTDDAEAARAAVTAYCEDVGLDVEYMPMGRLTAEWAVFEWQPEESESPWSVRWPAEGEDMAIRIHYLPS